MRDNSDARFDQLRRRVQIRNSIEKLTDADADAFSTAFGAEQADARRIVRAIGQRHHAHGMATVLKAARRMAGDAPIRAQHLRDTINDFFPHYQGVLK
jgi:hypothetical protein